jgi:UDP-2,3-diacylglucosamine hydrolase
MLVFVSDVHLTEPHTKKYEAFLSLIKECRDNDSIEEFFLCGDVFDLWLGHKSYFLKKHEQLINLLKEVASKKKVHIFEGNHDFHFKTSWWLQHNIKVHKESYEFSYQGEKFLVCHGDLLNKRDYGYRLLRWYFRSWLVKLQILIFPGILLNFIGSLLSTTDSKSSRVYGDQDKENFLKKWRVWVKEFKKEKDFDVFLCGHYHVRLIEEVDGLKTLNTGSWLGKNYKYLIYDNKKAEFKSIEA